MTSFAWRIQLYVNFFTSSQMTAAREKINNFLNLAFRKVEHLAICHAIAIYLSSIKFIQETCVLYGKTLHSEFSSQNIYLHFLVLHNSKEGDLIRLCCILSNILWFNIGQMQLVSKDEDCETAHISLITWEYNILKMFSDIWNISLAKCSFCIRRGLLNIWSSSSFTDWRSQSSSLETN